MFKKQGTVIIEADEGFSVKPRTMHQMIYSEGGKTLSVEIEILIGRFLLVVYAKDIKKWDSGDPIDEPSRRRIVENIRRAFAWDGAEIKVHW